MNSSNKSSLNKDLKEDEVVFLQHPQRAPQQRPLQIRPVEYPLAPTSRQQLLQTNINDLRAYESQVNKKLNQLRQQTQQNQFSNVFSSLNIKSTKYEQFKSKQKQKGRPVRNSQQVYKIQDPKLTQKAPNEQLGQAINDQMKFIRQVQSFKSQVSNYEYQYHHNMILQSFNRSRETVQSSQEQSARSSIQKLGKIPALQDSSVMSMKLQLDRQPHQINFSPINSSLISTSVKSQPKQKQIQAPQYDSLLDDKVLNKAIRLIQTPDMIMEESMKKIAKDFNNDASFNSSQKSSKSLNSDEYKKQPSTARERATQSFQSNNRGHMSTLRGTDPSKEITRGRYQLPVILTNQSNSEESSVQKETENTQQIMPTLTEYEMNTPRITSMRGTNNSKARRTIGEKSQMRQSFMQFRDLKISEKNNKQSQFATRVQSKQSSLKFKQTESKLDESHYNVKVPKSPPPKQVKKIMTIQNQQNFHIKRDASSKSKVTFSDDILQNNTKVILNLPPKFNQKNLQNDNTPLVDVGAWDAKLSSPRFNKYSFSANKRKEALEDSTMQKETTKKTIQRVISNESSPQDSVKKTATARNSQSPDGEIYQTIHRSMGIKGCYMDPIDQVHQLDGINKVTIKNQPKQDGQKGFQYRDDTLTILSNSHSPHFDLRVTDKLDTNIRNYKLKNNFDSKFCFFIEPDNQEFKLQSNQNKELMRNNFGRLYEGHKLKPTQSLIYKTKTQYKHNAPQQLTKTQLIPEKLKSIHRNHLNTSVQLVKGSKIFPNNKKSKMNNIDISSQLVNKKSKRDAQVQERMSTEYATNGEGSIIENDRAFQICFTQFQQSKKQSKDITRSPLSSGSPRLPFLSPVRQNSANKRNQNLKTIECSERLTRDLMIDTSQPLYQILQPKTNQFSLQSQIKKKGLRGGVNGRESKEIESFISYYISNQIK